MPITIVNEAMNGSEKTIVLPATIREVSFRAAGADITLRQTATTGDTFTIANGGSFSVEGTVLREGGLAGRTWYATGASGKLEMLQVTGENS
jgi:hypothetical protein